MPSTTSPFEAVTRFFQPPSERVRSAFMESIADHNRATADLAQALAAAPFDPLKAVGLLGEFCNTAGQRVRDFNQVVVDEWRAGLGAAPVPAPAADRAKSPPSPAPSAAPGKMAYCVRCKAQRAVADPVPTTMKNGRAALKGTCSVCGSGVFKIGG